jgi:hypothetical protein
MKNSDKTRGGDGVIVSFLQIDENTVRVYIDDAKNEHVPAKGPWVDRGIVTWQDYNLADFDDLKIQDEEFANFGHYVFARLKALKKHPH